MCETSFRCCVLELRCCCGRTITEHHRLKGESVAYVKGKVFCPTFFQKSWWSLRCCCVLELRCYCGRTITEHHRLKGESVVYVKDKVFCPTFFQKSWWSLRQRLKIFTLKTSFCCCALKWNGCFS